AGRAGGVRAIPRGEARGDPAQGRADARQRRHPGALEDARGDRQAARAHPSLRQRGVDPDVPSGISPAQPRAGVQEDGVGGSEAGATGVRPPQDAVIAEIAFDAPLPTPYAYRVPDGVVLRPGQRVRAILRDSARVGMVLGLRDGDASGLKALGGVVDPSPVITPDGLSLIRWIAGESLSSIGSTAAALLPPPLDAPAPSAPPLAVASAPRASIDASTPDLLTRPGRERRLLERITAHEGAVLVLTSDVETCARWAQRLAKIDRVARLDSDVDDAERASAWRDLAGGRIRLGVGTRGA